MPFHRSLRWLSALAGTALLPLMTVSPISAATHGTHAETYGIVESVFLQRDNDVGDQPLATTSSGATLITANQPAYTVQPGLRLFYGSIDECDTGWEAGYLGVWSMFADTDVTGAGIQAPEPFPNYPNAQGFENRTAARAAYLSTLNSVESSVLWRSCDGGFNRRANLPWQRCSNYRHGTFDWLLGFRWVGLDDTATMTYSGGSIPVPATYSAQTSSNLFGVQVGRRGRMEWDNWALEGWAKAMLGGAYLSQSQAPIIDIITPDPVIRGGRTRRDGEVGFVGDLNCSLIRRVTDDVSIRVGYNLIWLSGVAPAPDQFDFTTTAASGTGLDPGGNVFLHGANFGLERRW
jgi:hypothetical protein